MKPLVALLICLVCLPCSAATVLIGETHTAYQEFSGTNAEGLVNVDVSVCTTNPTAGGCGGSTVHHVGRLDGEQGVLEVRPTFVSGLANPLFPILDDALHTNSDYVTISYTWGYSPQQVTHTPMTFRVSELLAATTGGATGVSWTTTPHVPTGTVNFGGYTFDEFVFGVNSMIKEYFIPTSPAGAAEPYLYWVKDSTLRVLGHVGSGAGDGVPEPNTLWLVFLSLIGTGYWRAFRRL